MLDQWSHGHLGRYMHISALNYINIIHKDTQNQTVIKKICFGVQGTIFLILFLHTNDIMLARKGSMIISQLISHNIILALGGKKCSFKHVQQQQHVIRLKQNSCRSKTPNKIILSGRA